MHDRIFKGLLRAFLPDLLRLVVPQVAATLNLSRPAFLDKEFFTDWPKGTRRELDLLARVPWRQRSREHLLVHVEIEARATDRMARQLSSYRARSMPVMTARSCPSCLRPLSGKEVRCRAVGETQTEVAEDRQLQSAYLVGESLQADSGLSPSASARAERYSPLRSSSPLTRRVGAPIIPFKG